MVRAVHSRIIAAAERAWLRILARPPTDTERAAAVEFLAGATLEDLCLALFNANEFVYVD